MSADVPDSSQRQPDIHPSLIDVCFPSPESECPSTAVSNRMQRKWWSKALSQDLKGLTASTFPSLEAILHAVKKFAYHAERPCRMQGHPGHCSFIWGPGKVSAQTAELPRWTQAAHRITVLKPLTQFWLSY